MVEKRLPENINRETSHLPPPALHSPTSQVSFVSHCVVQPTTFPSANIGLDCPFSTWAYSPKAIETIESGWLAFLNSTQLRISCIRLSLPVHERYTIIKPSMTQYERYNASIWQLFMVHHNRDSTLAKPPYIIDAVVHAMGGKWWFDKTRMWMNIIHIHTRLSCAPLLQHNIDII